LMESRDRSERYDTPSTRQSREETLRPRLYEEYAYVLDFLSYGRPSTERQRRVAAPTVQVIGETYFTLLEAELKPGAAAAPHERIYVGRERREKIERVMGRISYQELTASAKAELQPVLEELIRNQEERFVGFFNVSQPVTPRMHALELLPGIGKKSMWQIVNAREKRPFESFKDIQERTSISDPVKILARRIVDELSGEGKYRLFSRTA
jgi:putative nucleotide binding protein